MADGLNPKLHQGLKQRHLSMIALGGVIGAGLFVGSGVVINTVGPGAFITYAATRRADRHGHAHAWRDGDSQPVDRLVRRLCPPCAGRLGGLLRRLAVLVLLGHRRRLRGGRRAQDPAVLAPGTPLWVLSLGLAAADDRDQPVLGASFGEFEFWFAGIKVATICSSSCSAACTCLGLWPNKSMDFSNLTAHGGFFPNGAAVDLLRHCGGDLLDGRRRDRHHRRGRVERPGARRHPGDQLGHRPHRCLLRRFDLPADDHPAVELHRTRRVPLCGGFEAWASARRPLMNAVVLTAVLSCLNSGLYTASRMLFVLAARREAPVSAAAREQSLGAGRRDPVVHVVGFLCVIAAAIVRRTPSSCSC